MQYDLISRDPQQDTPAAYCGDCKGEIYRGETTYCYDNQELCTDCFQYRVKRWVEKAPRETALSLGVEMTRYEG